MRILKIFAAALGLLLAISLIAGFIGREILLSSAVSQVRAAVRELKTIEIPATLTQSCLEYGGVPSENQALIASQLRFISSTEYVLEAVCQTTPAVRQVFQTNQLPPLVEKGAAQSGIIEGYDQGLTLSVLGRTGLVREEDTFVSGSLYYDPQTPVDLVSGPATICAGYGFSCCSDVSQVGRGAHQPQALDCPRSCYASCSGKPVVLHFASDPEFAFETRILQLHSGNSAQFMYTVSDIRTNRFALADTEGSLTLSEKLVEFLKVLRPQPAEDTLQKIVISFGDGESAEVSDLQGAVEHTYTCTRSLCVYNATIQALTESGTTSTLTTASKIQVHVQP